MIGPLLIWNAQSGALSMNTIFLNGYDCVAAATDFAFSFACFDRISAFASVGELCRFLLPSAASAAAIFRCTVTLASIPRLGVNVSRVYQWSTCQYRWLKWTIDGICSLDEEQEGRKWRICVYIYNEVEWGEKRGNGKYKMYRKMT